MAEKKAIKPVDIEDKAGAVAVPEGAEPPAVATPMVPGTVSGDFDMSDVTFPTLKIIQKMSKNPDKLDEGLITLDNSVLVGGDKNVANIVLVSVQKEYQEVVDRDAGVFPQRFETELEAREAGFRVARTKADRDSGVPIVNAQAKLLVLVEQPEGATDRAFPLTIDGKRYARARWWLQSASYGTAGKYIFTRCNIELNNRNLLVGKWTLGSDMVNGKKGTYYNPAIRLLEDENTDAFVAEAMELLSM